MIICSVPRLCCHNAALAASFLLLVHALFDHANSAGCESATARSVARTLNMDCRIRLKSSSSSLLNGSFGFSRTVS